MAAIEVGRECIKLKGRHAGQKVKIVKLVDKNFVEIQYASGKAKKCNILHLEPIVAK